MLSLIALCFLSFNIVSMATQKKCLPDNIFGELRDIRHYLARQDYERYLSDRRVADVQQSLKKIEADIQRLMRFASSNYTAVGESCYKIYNIKMDWFSAKAMCEADGAHLVSIETEKEQMVIEQLLAKYPDENFWTGGNDLQTEGTWVWNSTGKGIQYTNWYKLRPNGVLEPNNRHGTEHCMELMDEPWRLRTWNDDNCSSHRVEFLCEMPC